MLAYFPECHFISVTADDQKEDTMKRAVNKFKPFKSPKPD
jgi:hypothetical protein